MASDDTADEFAEFNADYRLTAPDRVHEVESLWSQLQEGETSPERMHALLRSLHSMAGSGSTFGMSALSDAAAAAELWIEPFCKRAAMPETARRGEFDALLAALRASAGG